VAPDQKAAGALLLGAPGDIDWEGLEDWDERRDDLRGGQKDTKDFLKSRLVVVDRSRKAAAGKVWGHEAQELGQQTKRECRIEIPGWGRRN